MDYVPILSTRSHPCNFGTLIEWLRREKMQTNRQNEWCFGSPWKICNFSFPLFNHNDFDVLRFPGQCDIDDVQLSYHLRHLHIYVCQSVSQPTRQEKKLVWSRQSGWSMCIFCSDYKSSLCRFFTSSTKSLSPRLMRVQPSFRAFHM